MNPQNPAPVIEKKDESSTATEQSTAKAEKPVSGIENPALEDAIQHFYAVEAVWQACRWMEGPRKTRERAINLLGNSQNVQNVQVKLVNDVQQFYNSSKHDTAAFQQLLSLHGISPEVVSEALKRRSANQNGDLSTKQPENSGTGSGTGFGDNTNKKNDGSAASFQQPGKDLEGSEAEKMTAEQRST